MKIWIVSAVWPDTGDLDYGDSNTTVIKVFTREPSQAEAERLVEEHYHDAEICTELKAEDPTDFKCSICPKEEKPPEEGDLDDKDEFGDGELACGFAALIEEAELES